MSGGGSEGVPVNEPQVVEVGEGEDHLGQIDRAFLLREGEGIHEASQITAWDILLVVMGVWMRGGYHGEVEVLFILKRANEFH